MAFARRPHAQGIIDRDRWRSWFNTLHVGTEEETETKNSRSPPLLYGPAVGLNQKCHVLQSFSNRRRAMSLNDTTSPVRMHPHTHVCERACTHTNAKDTDLVKKTRAQ
jgi:hypothetical protein